MLEWYNNKELLSIYFTEMPKPIPLFPTPGMTDEEVEELEKKPFKCLNEFYIILFDHKKRKKYVIKVEKGYRWDGASIPKPCWSLIGSPTDSAFLIPSLVHDKMCENKGLIGYDRYFSTIVLERLLYVSKVAGWRRYLMKHCVDNFQKTRNWKKPKEEGKC